MRRSMTRELKKKINDKEIRKATRSIWIAEEFDEEENRFVDVIIMKFKPESVRHWADGDYTEEVHFDLHPNWEYEKSLNDYIKEWLYVEV